MANKNFYIQTEATLQSFDAITRAEAPPFFYTRLLAKINNTASLAWWQQLFITAAKPAFSAMVLSMFLALNITAINMVLKDKKQSLVPATDQTLQGFAQEYNFSISIIYTDKKIQR